MGSAVNRFNSQPNETLSRYKSDFEELECIGGGTFGIVCKVINCLDGQQYAVKIILLKGEEIWVKWLKGKNLHKIQNE